MNLGRVFKLPNFLYKYEQMEKLCRFLPLFASACGSANGKVERRRRDGGNGAGATVAVTQAEARRSFG